MAVYVLSDVHGRLAALDRLLGRLSLGSDDWLFVLGDMVDRGPEPAGVMRLVKSLERTTTLMGNHEQLMLDALVRGGSDLDWFNWSLNGHETTAASLDALPPKELGELMEWANNLPLWAHARIGEQLFLLVHAGLRPGAVAVPDSWDDDAAVEEFLAAQDPEDLLWIRTEHWSQPTGLVNEQGEGPVVVSGHTPTLLIDEIVEDLGVDPWDKNRQAMRILFLGAGDETGRAYDRIALDCGAGVAQGIGRLAAIRLDDGEVFYEAIQDDE